MTYADFFEDATGHPPYPYQSRLAVGPWPELVDIPTGLGKTAAIVVAWLYRRLRGEEGTPRRLVYCLPMRSLVEQTAQEAGRFVGATQEQWAARGMKPPAVHKLMGGAVAQGWDAEPEAAAILVGTQDQLLSRALNRGYATSRFRWPMQFAAMHNDALWVFDETQLMGVGLTTSAQLEGLRQTLGVVAPCRSLWMSATLNAADLTTVDHPAPPEGRRALRLADEDRAHPRVQQRLSAAKAISRVEGVTLKGKRPEKQAPEVARAVMAAHQPGTLTLVVVNRVNRAQAVYQALIKLGRSAADTGLIHSRFRPPDRQAHMARLRAKGDRIIVATQAIEAGMDIDAQTLITELAPWPSLVQRFGRLNRAGARAGARALWVNIDDTSADSCLPYEGPALAQAREHLTQAAALGGVGPARLSQIAHEPPEAVRPVLRRRDLLDLFDTTPDLGGMDLDISRYIRDSADTDVQIFWRALSTHPPDAAETAEPSPDELCRVSVGAMATFMTQLDTLRKRGGPSADRYRVYRWDAADSRWAPPRRPRPGQVLLLNASAGGYGAELGFVGAPGAGTGAVAPIPPVTAAPPEGLGDDPASMTGVWVELTAHLGHVKARAQALTQSLPAGPFADAVIEAAAFHDVGKAHPVFQAMLTGAEAPPAEGAHWAKSGHNKGKASRRGFRHELASALAWLAWAPDGHPHRDLVAYLVAAHHGKIRLSLRALPSETAPPQPGRRFARGVWEGDALPDETAPPITLTHGEALPPMALSLEAMGLGAGSWLELSHGLLGDDALGPFRLAWLETLVRVADWRASEAEKTQGGNAR